MVSRYSGPLAAWRIADNRDPLWSGAGAAMYGARWNSPGHRVIYASRSFACAMLETLARSGIGKVPGNQVSIRIDIPASVAIEEIDEDDVSGWDAAASASRAFGDAWIRSRRTCVLVVLSAVARHECNVLINEAHAEFQLITATEPQPVVWDRRLFE